MRRRTLTLMRRWPWLCLGVVMLCACAPNRAASFREHYENGLRAYEAGRRTEAIAEYREAVRLKPDAAEAHNSLGAVLYNVGEAEAAIQEYRRALRLNPDLAEAHNNLGVALLSTGHFAAAVGEYRQAVELKPEFTEARYNLCLGLELLGQLSEALVQCQLVAQREPGRPGVAGAVERLRGKLDQR